MNPNVSKAQMLRLLDKLAHDDLFRSRFERNPCAALRETGFAAADVANFPAQQLVPGTLAAKEIFAAEHERVAKEVIDTHACMVAPGPMLSSRYRVSLTKDAACAA